MKPIYLIIVISIIAAGFLVSSYYDPNVNDAYYCDTYARTYLHDIHFSYPYYVNFNVAKTVCTPPKWEYVCGQNKNQGFDPLCNIARSERV